MSVETLGSLACLWLAGSRPQGPAPLRMTRYLPQARRVAPADRAAQRRETVAMPGALVLVMREDELPYSVLPAMPVEPLANAGHPVAYMARNTVTGGFEARHGPELWPREALLEALTGAEPLPRPETVLPVALAEWHCNPSAGAAFAAGHERLSEGGDAPGIVECLASLGADAAHGWAWIAGACHALLGTATARAAEARWLDDAPAMQARAAALARRVRTETGFTVRALSPAESRLLKGTLFEMPEARHFLSAAERLDALGEGERAALYREAVVWLWGDQRSAAAIAPEDTQMVPDPNRPAAPET